MSASPDSPMGSGSATPAAADRSATELGPSLAATAANGSITNVDPPSSLLVATTPTRQTMPPRPKPVNAQGGSSSNVSATTPSAAASGAANSSSSGSGSGLAERIVLQLWDTAGQETSAALSSVYYRGARGVAVVYDVTRRTTLFNVGRWVASARQHCDPDCVIVVIGNKTDLRHSVDVPEEEARAFCHSLGCRHYLASAMNGEGVEYAFLQLLLAVHAVALSRGVANEDEATVERRMRSGQHSRATSNVDGGGEVIGTADSGIAGFRLRRPAGSAGSKFNPLAKLRGRGCCSS